ncbi:MAG: 3-phosphoglycerate dehydrogenase family protein [Candidatus Alectryocaccobium sp.]|nr:3-phosphoglycerate dehydrogenase family protein [Candidatus Alectryocaccobium sp.]
MIKYACLNPIAEVGLKKLPESFEKTDVVEEAEAILVRSAKMHEMQFSDKLLAVARAGAGVNNIPLDTLAKKGVVVFNTPGANANGVKELVLAGLLLSSRDIIGGVEWVKSELDNPEIEKLVEKKKKQFAGCEIKGKKLGIIGLGAIGQMVANAAIGLGMEVYGYDPYISIDGAWNLSRSIKHINDVKDIYSQCDYITIHVPALDSTKGMINEEAISLMKPSTVILNFARDILVDEPALVKALKEGRVRKYVTDFANMTVADAPNVIITPHIGASTVESEDNCAIMAARELKDYILNGNIKNSVNYPRCDLGECQSAGRIAILHENKVNMISTFTGMIADAGINISNLTNKSKGDYAYTLIDVESPETDALLGTLLNTEGVLRVRKVK